MGFDAAFTRPEVLGTAALVLLPGLLLELFFWIVPPKRGEGLEVADRVLARVKPALAGAGIDVPYPTMQALLHGQTEATDGDRDRQRGGRPARGGGQDRPRRPNDAAGQAP